MSTHYLEEAKFANTVAFMRGGVLLAEDSPQNVLNRFKVSSLEDVFLLLCQKQGSEEGKGIIQGRRSVDVSKIKIWATSKTKKATRKTNILSRSKMKALITKNYLQLVRQPL